MAQVTQTHVNYSVYLLTISMQNLLVPVIPDFDPIYVQDLSEGKYLRGTKSSYIEAWRQR